MPEISNKKKKFIKRNFKRLSIEELSYKAGLKPNIVRSLVDEYNAKMPGKDRDSLELINGNSILTKRSVKMTGMVAVTIFLIAFMVYTPSLQNDFVYWDDNEYVYENTNIQSLNSQSLHWMLTSFHASNWHPVTWLSHALDCTFWGLNPERHHLTNILLHGFNTVLVFFLVVVLILRTKVNFTGSYTSKDGLQISAPVLIAGGVTALLFGLHPLHVESVAWVSERKDLLCAFFVLLSILSYLSYTSSAVFKKRFLWFVMSLLFFTCALMSKPMAVTLPVIILLLDIYPLRRSINPGKNLAVLLEKIPFFALSIASAIITIVAQRSGGAVVSFEHLSLSVRLLNPLNSLVFYLEKMIWPAELVPFYPFPKYIYPLDPQYIISGILVLAITGSCLWMVKRGNYLFFIAWLYYVVTLLPVLGIMQVGNQAAADRYSYLPSIGPFFLMGIGIAWTWHKVALMEGKRIGRGSILTFTFAIMFLLSCLTVKQIKIWQNSETLWSYVIDAFPEKVPVAHNNLGLSYSREGKLDKAIKEYKQALAINPNYAEAHNNLGIAYTRKRRLDEAVFQFKKALAIKPGYAKAHSNLGIAYADKGNLSEAIAEHKRALDINPNLTETYNNLAAAYYFSRNYRLAIIYCDKAIELGGIVNPKLLELLKPYR